MKPINKWVLFGATLLILLSYPLTKTYQTRSHHFPVLGLLIPNSASNLLATKLWMKAAEEEGVPLETISYDEFTSPFQLGTTEPKGIIVPDEVSQSGSATLIAYLQEYVNRGGKLVLIGDALMHELNGRLKETFPAESVFQFPPVLGRQGDTIQFQRDTLRISDDWKKKLQIPPGQTSPPDSVNASFREFCTYQTLHAQYPHFKTALSGFTGTKILEAGDGSLVAGTQKLGKGDVLWLNLPLSYLKRRTDGLLMHSFLRWIDEEWLALPRLLAVPNGEGGIVLNVHVDSNAALPYLTQLKEMGFFEDGPFSIHLTAGPDTRAAKDGLGLNLNGNKVSQEWVRYWKEHGHEVGSHGGWIHDYFGLHIGDQETPEFTAYLEKNFDAVKKALGEAPTEYSAPLGNQPIWVNAWLRKKGYHSYYFVGDNGMGPTQNFRDTEFTDEGLWSFPVASYLQVASFEEAEDQKIPKKEMTAWLNSLSAFVSENHLARLFYFHPPGIQRYRETLTSWMKENSALAKAGQFKWYTMERLSKFLSTRSLAKWDLHPGDDASKFEIHILPQTNLHEMVWRLPKSAVKQVKAISGKAVIRENGNEIEIQPENDAGVVIQYEENAHD